MSVEKARLELAEARRKQVRVFRAGRGFVYQADESGIQSAQEKLTKSIEDLSEYKYEMALERAEEFIEDFSKLAEADKSVFLSGWESLFDSYGDLLDSEFSSFLKKAQDYVEKFKEEFSNLDEEQETLLTKTAYQNKIAELELEREQYEKGSAEYGDLSQKIAALQDKYLQKFDANYKSKLGTNNASTSGSEFLDWYENSLSKKAIDAIVDVSIFRAGMNEEGNWDWGEFAKSFIPGYSLSKMLGWKWFAKGTNYAPGGTAIVGEEGPELVDLPMGARVHTASETSNILSSLTSNGNGRTLVFNGDLSFPNVRTENDAEGFINGLLQIGNNGKPQFI